MISKAPELLAVLTTFLVLTWFFTLLRVYVRCCKTKSWGADDILLLATLLFFTAYNVCAFVGVAHGFGIRSQDFKHQNVAPGLMLFWLFELIYAYTTILLRCSVAVLLLRICVKTSHKMVIYVTMSTVLLFTTFYSFLVIFQCTPVNYYWTRFETDTKGTGTCIDPKIFPIASFAHSGICAGADWILGLLPVWLLWRLKMNLQTKVYVSVALGFGMVAGVAALIRIPYIQRLSTTDEFFFNLVDVVTWSAIEPGIGIIATAACVLRPLFTCLPESSSSNGGYAPQDLPNRVTAVRVRIPGGSESHPEREDVELQSRETRTASRSSPISVRGADWWKNKPSANGNFIGNNESEEELTGSTKAKVSLGT